MDSKFGSIIASVKLQDIQTFLFLFMTTFQKNIIALVKFDMILAYEYSDGTM